MCVCACACVCVCVCVRACACVHACVCDSLGLQTCGLVRESVNTEHADMTKNAAATHLRNPAESTICGWSNEEKE